MGGGRALAVRAAEEVLPGYVARAQLGAGSFGRVFLLEHRSTLARVAVKTLRRERLGEGGAEERLRREVQLLGRLRHPNVIRLYDVRETSRYIVLVMEYAQNGELFEYITERGRLSETEARRIFQQMIAGVECCHRRMVVHRDLKPENILLDAQWTVKVADFGLGNIMREGHFLTTSCGSPNYAAPEVICGRPYCGPEVDVWGIGVVLYTLLCGRLPFDEKSHVALYQKIKVAAYPRASHVSPAAQDLLARLLVVDPTLRATIPEVRRHPWFLPWFIPQEISHLGENQNHHHQQQMMSDGEIASSSTASSSIANSQQISSSPEGTVSFMRQDSLSPESTFSGTTPFLFDRGNVPSISQTPWSEDGQLQHRIWGEAKWAPGTSMRINSRNATDVTGRDAMLNICNVLRRLSVSWKFLGPYTLKCRKAWERGGFRSGGGSTLFRDQEARSQRGSVRKRAASEANIDVHIEEGLRGYGMGNGRCEREEMGEKEMGEKEMGERGSNGALEIQERLWELRFEVQLYSGGEGEWIVDFCSLGGLSSLVFLDFCTQFRSTVLKMSDLLP